MRYNPHYGPIPSKAQIVHRQPMVGHPPHAVHQPGPPQGIPQQPEEQEKRNRKRSRQPQVKNAPQMSPGQGTPVNPKAVSQLYNPHHQGIYNPAGPRPGPPQSPNQQQRPIMIRAHNIGGHLRPQEMIPVINPGMIHHPPPQQQPPPQPVPPQQQQPPPQMMIQQPINVHTPKTEKMDTSEVELPSDLIPDQPGGNTDHPINEEAKKRDILNFLMDIPQASSPSPSSTQPPPETSNNNVTIKTDQSAVSVEPPNQESPIFKVPALPPKKKV